MKSSHQIPFSVSWDQVAAFRLSRHHLLKRAAAKDFLSVVRDMIGAQAQLMPAAQISLWSRTNGLEITDIEDAIVDRSLVKAACMRRTLFLVPSAFLATFVRGCARRAEKEIRWARGKGVPDGTIEAAIVAALNALDQPRTRSEIAELTCQTLGVGMKNIHGGGWGSRGKVAAVPVGELTYPVVDLLHLVGARDVVCYGPYRGNEPTFVRAGAWIPQWQDSPRKQAEEALLRMYLKSFGPATAKDFAMWTGMTLTEARELWARGQTNFASVDVEGWEAEILQEDLEDLSQACFEKPSVRLLPYFDTFLLGHKEREHLVSISHQPSVFRPQGWIAPVVLVNGRILGVWKHTQKSNRLQVDVTTFDAISKSISAGISEKAQDLGRFLGSPNVEVQIE